MMPALALTWTALCFGIYLAAWLPGFHPVNALWFWRCTLPPLAGVSGAMALHGLAMGWVVLINAAALAAGQPLFSFLLRGRVSHGLVIRLVIGLGVVLPTAALGFGLAGLFRPPLLVALLCAAAVPGASIGWARRRTIVVPRQAALGLAAVLLVPSLIRALAPQIEYDALRYHFALPHGYLLHGRIIAGEPRPLSHLPLGAEMLLALGMAGDGDTAAQLLNWQWLPLLLVLASASAAAMGFAGALAMAGWVALASSPLLTSLGGGGFIDLQAGVLLATAFLLILARPRGHLVACSVLTGAAGGAKLGMVPLGLAWLAPLVPVAGWSGAAAGWAVPLTPWFLKNWLLTGSPFGGIALTRFWPSFDHAANITQLYLAARWTAVGDPAVWLALPHFLIHGGVIEGHEISPLLVIALPALFLGWGRREAATRRIRIAAVSGLVTWIIVGGGQVRYLVPLLLPITAAAAAGWFTPSRALLLGGAALGWFRITSGAFQAAAPLPVVLGAVSPRVYLAEHLSPREVYVAMGTWLAGQPELGRPYVAGDLKAYYWSRDPLVDAEYNLPALFEWARDAQDAGRLAVRFRQRGIGCLVHRVEGALTFQQIAGGYPWTDRTLRIGQEFLLRRTVEVYRLERPAENTFYRVHAWSAARPAPAARTLHWLDMPYAELLTNPADHRIEAGNLSGARADYTALARRFPSWIIPPLRLAEIARRTGDHALERRLEADADRLMVGAPRPH